MENQGNIMKVTVFLSSDALPLNWSKALFAEMDMPPPNCGWLIVFLSFAQVDCCFYFLSSSVGTAFALAACLHQMTAALFAWVDCCFCFSYVLHFSQVDCCFCFLLCHCNGFVFILFFCEAMTSQKNG